jgi:hypothetical protein
LCADYLLFLAILDQETNALRSLLTETY